MSDYIKLDIGISQSVLVRARSHYGGHLPISVVKGERYLFEARPNDRWIDMFKSCNADGFYNRFASGSFLRVKDALCFTLCATIDNSIWGGYKIGLKREFLIPKSGMLYFFANDHPRFYWNNFGTVEVKVKRLADDG